MDVNVNKEIVNGDFVVTITTEGFTSSEEDLLTKWGVPKIQIGGAFPLTVTISTVQHDAAYTYPEEERLLKKFRLVRRRKALNVSRELETIHEAQLDDYASVVEARLQDAITDLKGLADGFTEDTTNTY